MIGWSAGFTFWYDGGTMPVGSCRRVLEIAACTGGAADALKRIDLADLGMTTGGIFERGLPGMCKELAQ